MGIIDEIKAAGEKLGDRKDELTERVSDLVGVLADRNADWRTGPFGAPFFALVGRC